VGLKHCREDGLDVEITARRGARNVASSAWSRPANEYVSVACRYELRTNVIGIIETALMCHPHAVM